MPKATLTSIQQYLNRKIKKNIFAAYQMIPPQSREKTTKKISEPQMTKWLIQVQ